MIDWFYQTCIDVTLVIVVILLLRIPVRHYFGAKAAYWLWLVPLLRFLIWDKAEVPVAILEKVTFPDNNIMIKVFNNPEYYVWPAALSLEFIWLLGFCTWIALRFVAWLKFKSVMKARSKPINIGDVMADITDLTNHRSVQFYTTTIPQAPFVTGVFKPRVYLPQTQFSDYSEIQQKCIIKHELTHVARKDLWWQMLAELFRALLWFNPVVHIAWKIFRHDQELACDHDVLAESNHNERYEYGLALLKGLHAHALPSMMAFFNGHKQRFVLLERHKPSQINRISGIFICALLLAFSLIKAPKSMASEKQGEKLTKGMISFHFENIPLRSMMQLSLDSEGKKLIGLSLIPDIKVTVAAENVSAEIFQALILKCNGLTFVPKGDAYELVNLDVKNNTVNDIGECVESFNG